MRRSKTKKKQKNTPLPLLKSLKQKQGIGGKSTLLSMTIPSSQHTVIFVIAPLIKKNVKTHLDRLLTIFSDTAPNSKFIELDEYYDNSEDYRTIMRVLQKASSDKQLRGNLDLEQYAWVLGQLSF